VVYLFYSLNVCFYIAFGYTIVNVKRRFFGLRWLNPFLILYCAFLPVDLAKLILGPYFLLEKGLAEPYLGVAILITNISLLTKLALIMVCLCLFDKFSPFVRVPLKNRYISMLKLHFLEILFFIVSLVLFYFMADSNFGFVNWLKSPRTGYQYHRVGVGGLYALSLTFLSLAFTIGLVRQKSLIKKITKTVIYLPVIYFWGSKGFLISFYVFFLIIVWFYNNKFFILISVLTVVPIVFGVLFNLHSAVGALNLEKFGEYFNYYYNSANFYKAYFSGEFSLLKGKIFVTDFWALVPRALYPEKPFVYGILHVNEFFYPGMAAKTHTPAFGGPVALFADFGLLGVIAGSFFDFYYVVKLYLTYVLFKLISFESVRYNTLHLFVFIVVFSPKLFWRIPLLYSLPIFFIVFVFTNILAVVVVRYRRRALAA